MPPKRYTTRSDGWKVDILTMRLSAEKFDALGWDPPNTSNDEVHRAARDLIEEIAEEESVEVQTN